MKLPKLLGIYPLGYENVELWVDPLDPDGSGGGWIALQGAKGHAAEIHIMLGESEDWEHTVYHLLHETREFQCIRRSHRYRESQSYNHNSAAYLYVYDHQQGAEMDQAQASFLTRALPVLSKAFQKVANATKKGKKH